jgi:hypothetical protein
MAPAACTVAARVTAATAHTRLDGARFLRTGARWSPSSADRRKIEGDAAPVAGRRWDRKMHRDCTSGTGRKPRAWVTWPPATHTILTLNRRQRCSFVLSLPRCRAFHRRRLCHTHWLTLVHHGAVKTTVPVRKIRSRLVWRRVRAVEPSVSQEPPRLTLILFTTVRFSSTV